MLFPQYDFFPTVQHGDPVTHTCVYYFSHIIMLHHKWLNIVLHSRISLHNFLLYSCCLFHFYYIFSKSFFSFLILFVFFLSVMSLKFAYINHFFKWIPFYVEIDLTGKKGATMAQRTFALFFIAPSHHACLHTLILFFSDPFKERLHVSWLFNS